MRKITIEMIDGKCKITEETEMGEKYSFSKTVRERSEMFLALAKYYNVDLQDIVNIQDLDDDEFEEFDFDEEEFENIANDICPEDICALWLSELLGKLEKCSPEDLTEAEVRKEMREVKVALLHECDVDHQELLQQYINLLQKILMKLSSQEDVSEVRWNNLQNFSNETVKVWLDDLLEAAGKTLLNELTVEEIKKELEEVKGSIENFEVMGDHHAVMDAEDYIEVLKELLKTAQ